MLSEDAGEAKCPVRLTGAAPELDGVAAVQGDWLRLSERADGRSGQPLGRLKLASARRRCCSMARAALIQAAVRQMGSRTARP